jgi:hypothetical protein
LLLKTEHRVLGVSPVEVVSFCGFFIPFLIWSFAAVCNELEALGANMKTDNGRPLLAISQSNRYVSIQELQDFCGASGICGQKMACEGQLVFVRSFIDYGNVYHKGVYPHLPYEKFRIYDKPGGQSLEVWAIAEDNTLIFKEIMKGKERSQEKVHIRGIVAGFDMAAQNMCRRGIKLEINDSESIFFNEFF